MIRRPKLWSEMIGVISGIDADACKTITSSEEEETPEKTRFSSTALDHRFRRALRNCGWADPLATYQANENEHTAQVFSVASNAAKGTPTTLANRSRTVTINPTDLLKEGTALNVQIGTCSPTAEEFFASHLSFFVSNVIDVGIRILPMERFEAELTSRSPYFELDRLNLVQYGRGVPAVPLVLIGVQA